MHETETKLKNSQQKTRLVTFNKMTKSTKNHQNTLNKSCVNNDKTTDRPNFIMMKKNDKMLNNIDTNNTVKRHSRTNFEIDLNPSFFEQCRKRENKDTTLKEGLNQSVLKKPKQINRHKVIKDSQTKTISLNKNTKAVKFEGSVLNFDFFNCLFKRCVCIKENYYDVGNLTRVALKNAKPLSLANIKKSANEKILRSRKTRKKVFRKKITKSSSSNKIELKHLTNNCGKGLVKNRPIVKSLAIPIVQNLESLDKLFKRENVDCCESYEESKFVFKFTGKCIQNEEVNEISVKNAPKFQDNENSYEYLTRDEDENLNDIKDKIKDHLLLNNPKRELDRDFKIENRTDEEYEERIEIKITKGYENHEKYDVTRDIEEDKREANGTKTNRLETTGETKPNSIIQAKIEPIIEKKNEIHKDENYKFLGKFQFLF